MAFPTSSLYQSAIRNGAAIHYTVDASVNGQPVPGATGLRPVGGNITDTTKPGVRRVLNLDLAPERGLFDALSPIGTMLTVTAHVRFTDRTTLDIPMGVFDVDSEKISEGGGGLSLTAPDKWVKIKRARFLAPASSDPGVSVIQQIIMLIRDALGPNEPVNVTATSTAQMSPLVWDKDRDQAIIGLAQQIGAWVFFDRYGVATIADAPRLGVSADWLVDASASGVLTSLDRSRDRSKTFNVVSVSSSAADGERFPTQWVWDQDPASPTFAGSTNPMYAAADVGPFGIVSTHFESPILDSAEAAQAAGRTILARTTGLASQVSLGMVPNCAIDAWDVLDVLPPAERVTTVALRTVDPAGSLYPSDSLYPSAALLPSSGQQVPVLVRNTTGAILERHVADTVSHPLRPDLKQEQTIEGRSTRTDEYS